MIPAPLTERDFVKAFLALMLCSLVGGALAGAIVGAVFGVAGAESTGAIRIAVPVISGLAGFVITYFLFRFFVLRFIVRKLVQ